MSKKQTGSHRHIPHRTCVGCREVLSKREMMRIVRSADHVHLDPSGKANGRGAYVHNNRDCWEKALNGRLEKALHTTINEDDQKSLRDVMNTLKADRDE